MAARPDGDGVIYLSGGVPPQLTALVRPDLGVMMGPGKGNRAPLIAGLPWGADNGCFAAGERFDDGPWLAWLSALLPWRERCLFAVAPDVVGDAARTLKRAMPYLPLIRALGYPPAYVSQNDADRHPIPWAAFDCLFIGGTTDWKLSERSYALAAEAKRRGKWVHMGRVNSLRRLRACRASFIDSADGTHLAFKPDDRLPQLIRWLDGIKAQSVMEVAA